GPAPDYQRDAGRPLHLPAAGDVGRRADGAGPRDGRLGHRPQEARDLRRAAAPLPGGSVRRAVLALGGLLSVAVAARQRPVAHYRHSLRAVALTVVLPDS